MPPKQLVYVDESGDTGFKVGKGSTATLVLVAVIFDSPEGAEATADCIAAYRESIGKGKTYGFHFSNLQHEWRLGLLEAVRDCPFRVRAVVMRKDRIWEGTKLKTSGDYFYRYTFKLLLRDAFAGIKDAKLFVDGKAGRTTLRKLVNYLRQQCNDGDARVFSKITQVPKNQNNVLVQLADVCAGAIARSYQSDRKDPWCYRKVINRRVENVFDFGNDA
jgi:hypothetical protein